MKKKFRTVQKTILLDFNFIQSYFFSLIFYRYELLNVQKVAKEDKKQLRRCLKEHELKFLEANGRPMPKDELKEHEFYSKYKMTKAKLKLVDALLSKSMKP